MLKLFQHSTECLFIVKVILKTYFHYIVSASNTYEESIDYFRKVMPISRDNELKLNKAMLKIEFPTVTYLKHHLP